MKFKSSIIIDRPQKIVAAYFADPQYLGEYQDGFLRKELVSGNAGEEGAISKMYYQYGKNEMELTETITSNQLPDSFSGFYHHKHMDNTMKCRFVPVGETQTRYESDFEYTRMNWIMPRLIAILFPGMYKRQGEKWMKNFKRFVESQPE